MLHSLDTETTGKDFFHGCEPFFVTWMQEDQKFPTYWHWRVDPKTREVDIPIDDLKDIVARLDNLFSSSDPEEEIVLQNGKFDFLMLHCACQRRNIQFRINWKKVQDTLLCGHMLASSMPHDLTSMVQQYLGARIDTYENNLEEVVKAARNTVRSKFPTWQIAKEGHPMLPSLKPSKSRKKEEEDSVWKYDTWLPNELANELNLPSDHPYHNSLTTYANADSCSTLYLWKEMRKYVDKRKLGKIYNHRRRLLPIVFDMERSGITLNGTTLKNLETKLIEESKEYGHVIENIARSYGYPCQNEYHTKLISRLQKHEEKERLRVEKYTNWKKTNTLEQNQNKLISPRDRSRRKVVKEPCFSKPYQFDFGQCPYCKTSSVNRPVVPYYLDLPSGAVNDSLRAFLFDVLKLEKLSNKKSKSDSPSLDKNALEHYSLTLKPRSKELKFIKSLRTKRAIDTHLGFLSAYKRFARLIKPNMPPGLSEEQIEWYVLNTIFNITGTDTLRFSSKNPNAQQISKKEELNLRVCFGPAPGREWYSLDARNIEARLPAYKSNEQDLINLYEKELEPPYYGSGHLLNFHTVYPEIWEKELAEHGIEKVGPVCKKKYAATWYQYVKNGGFAVQYGAVEKSDGWGTADQAFHKQGSHALLKARFSKLERLNQWCIQFAEKNGYVETMPELSVDPERGYPILCSRTEWGKILPTLPLNYYIQGTAMQWMASAMIRCYDYLNELNRKCKIRDHYRIAIQVHDELVFDFPKRSNPKEDPTNSNLSKIMHIRDLMQEGGKDIGIPTPVSVEYHPVSWNAGISL